MRPYARALAASLLTGFLLFPTPAQAKGLLEFEIYGHDLARPVAIPAGTIANRVHGWVMGGDEVPRPAAFSGPVYVMLVYSSVPRGTEQPLVWVRQPGLVSRWTYYLGSGGAVTEDGTWIPFSPALQRVIREALQSETRTSKPFTVRYEPFILALGGLASLSALYFSGRLRLRFWLRPAGGVRV